MDVAALVEAHVPLARKEARIYCKQRRLYGHVPEDVYADALVGLWRAAMRWRPGGGASFRTYAKRRIRGEILDRLRKTSHARRLPPWPTPTFEGWPDDEARIVWAA